VSFAVVREQGKNRGVTIGSAECGVLSPLHKALYNRLSRLPWLLRGEAKPCKFRDFVHGGGEVFVSGDYESATDFLPLEVAEAMLEVALQNSSWIPSSLGKVALRSLRSNIKYEDCEYSFEQVCGQLMGNLLSFPLLCLQNFAAFRWVFPDSRPVRINGDDIVFRSTRAEFDQWAEFVGQVGLRLSRGKTLVSSRFFSVNSHFFRAGKGLPRLIPVLRTGGLVKLVTCVSGLGGAFRSFTRGFQGPALDKAQTVFLRWRKRYIFKAGRSVTSMGIFPTVQALQGAGLWRREAWFVETGLERPLPVDPSRLQWCRPPGGWERVPFSERRSVRRRQREVERSFWSLLTSDAWLDKPRPGVLLDQYFHELSTTGRESLWRGWCADKKRWPAICHPNLSSRDRCQMVSGSRCPHVQRFSVKTEKVRSVLFSRTARVRRCWAPIEGEDPRTALLK
jgi:hypothetical protein